MAVPESIARRQEQWRQRWEHVYDAALRLSQTTPHFTYGTPTGGSDMPDEQPMAAAHNPYNSIADFPMRVSPRPEPGLTVVDIDGLIRHHERAAEERVQATIPAAQAHAFNEGTEAGREGAERVGRRHEHSQVDIAFGNVIHHLHLVAAIARRTDLTKKAMESHLLAIETLLALVINRFGSEAPDARGVADRQKVLPIPDPADLVNLLPKDADGEPMSLADVCAALRTAYGASYGKKPLERMVAAEDFSDQLDPHDYEEPSVRV